MKKIIVFATALYAMLMLISSTNAQISTQKKAISTTAPGMNNRESLLTKNLLPEGFTTIKEKLPFTTKEKEYVVKMQAIDGTPYFNYILDGDIIVGDNLPKTKIFSTDDNKYLWRDDVPIFLHQSVNDSNMCETVNLALAMIENNTKIHFVMYNNHKDYIQLRIGDPGGFSGGRSPIGRKGGMQEIIYSKDVNTGVIVHEILHSLGIYHEQSRKDRENYVWIIKENIDPKYAYNFNIVPGINQTDYDYSSIMHYFATAFSKDKKNKLPTIKCVKNGIEVPCPDNMGQQDGLSSQDITGINSLYKYVSFTPSRYPVKLEQSNNIIYLRILFDPRYISQPPNTAIGDIIGFKLQIPGNKMVRNNICTGQQEFVSYSGYAETEPTIEFTEPVSYSQDYKVSYLTLKNLPVEKRFVVAIEPYLKMDCLPGTANQQKPDGNKVGFRTWIEMDDKDSDTYILKGNWFNFGIIPPNILKKGFQMKNIKSDGPINQPGIEMKKEIKPKQTVPVKNNIPVKQ